MVGGAVFAHQPRAVETEHHVQTQQSRVVDDVVVGALGKSAVDVAERHHPLLGHPRREGDGVAFGDAHVEGAFGKGALHEVHAATGEHGRRDTHDAIVGARQFHERFAEHILEFRRGVAGRGGNKPHARFTIELARRVPHHGVALGPVVALAFHRFDVQQTRTRHGAQGAKQPNERDHVVTVVGTEVTNVEAFEYVLLRREKRLEGIVETNEAFAARGGQQAPALQAARQTIAQTVVGRGGVEIEQVAFHPPDRVGDAHVVVVEDDEQVVGRLAHVVEPFEGQPAAHGPIADDGHHVLVGLAALHGGHTHAERSRNRVGGVAAREGVIFALGRRGKRPHASPAAIGVERVAAPGENFVPVGLVSHVPNDAIVGGGKHVVQRHRQFDGAEAGGQVAGILRQFVEDVGTQFAAELRQLPKAQFAQVRRAVDAGEERVFFLLRHVCSRGRPVAAPGEIIRRRLRPIGCGGRPSECIAASWRWRASCRHRWAR